MTMLPISFTAYLGCALLEVPVARRSGHTNWNASLVPDAGDGTGDGFESASSRASSFRVQLGHVYIVIWRGRDGEANSSGL